jgi:hypothetical protein
MPPAPVGNPLVQQHQQRGAARPAFPGQIAPLARDYKPLAHAVILIGTTRRRKNYGRRSLVRQRRR